MHVKLGVITTWSDMPWHYSHIFMLMKWNINPSQMFPLQFHPKIFPIYWKMYISFRAQNCFETPPTPMNWQKTSHGVTPFLHYPIEIKYAIRLNKNQLHAHSGMFSFIAFMKCGNVFFVSTLIPFKRLTYAFLLKFVWWTETTNMRAGWRWTCIHMAGEQCVMMGLEMMRPGWHVVCWATRMAFMCFWDLEQEVVQLP